MADADARRRRLSRLVADPARLSQLAADAGRLLRRAWRGIVAGIVFLAGYIASELAFGKNPPAAMGWILLAWLAAIVVATAWPLRESGAIAATSVADDADEATALPNATRAWLSGRLDRLPPAAKSLIAAIDTRLDVLDAQFTNLPETDPARNDARRLLGSHLPTLVDRYLDVPQASRGAIEARFIAGLATIDGELAAMLDRLDADDRNAFMVQDTFLETRYRVPTITGNH